MRVSTYEIILPLVGKDDKKIEGKSLLVNGLYGSLDIVDAQIAGRLEKGDADGLPIALRERLATRGHITRKDEEGELADARLLGRIWKKLVSFSGVSPVIMPTYDCNFRCPYCFERNRLANGQEWLGQAMKPEMVETVFAGLQKQRDKGHRIGGIALYGGEPLLKENRETVRNICEHARAMGLDISGITNGYDLDSYIDILEEFGFTCLQITVDGVGELNDCRRLHRDGVPTYERIMSNISLALEHGVDISLRVNVNGQNIGGIRELIDDIASRGLKEGESEGSKGHFSYYFKAVAEKSDSPTKVTEQQVMDAILEAGIPPMEAIRRESTYLVSMRELTKAMEKEDYPKFSPAFCGAEQGMMCIAPDGLLYSCWDEVAKQENAVGFTDEESGCFFFNFTKAKWRTRTSDLMESCRTCPYIFICRGGCSAVANLEYGSGFHEYCGESGEIFAYVASRTVGKKWEETKEAELSVSLAGPVSRLTEEERGRLMSNIGQKEMFDIVCKAGFFISERNEDEIEI